MSEETKPVEQNCGCGCGGSSEPAKAPEAAAPETGKCCCGGKCGKLAHLNCAFKTFFWLTVLYVAAMGVINWVMLVKTSAANGIPVNYQVGILQTLSIVILGAIAACTFMFMGEASNALHKLCHDTGEIKEKLEIK